MSLYDYDYDYEDRMADARADAAHEAWLDRLEPCGGSGEAYMACSGRHRYGCGGPDCDGDYVECPGCSDCEPDED